MLFLAIAGAGAAAAVERAVQYDSQARDVYRTRVGALTRVGGFAQLLRGVPGNTVFFETGLGILTTSSDRGRRHSGHRYLVIVGVTGVKRGRVSTPLVLATTS